MSLKIECMSKQNISKRKIKEPLPDPKTDQPFRMILNGRSGSGKSNVLANMLRKFYYRYFDKVFICSPTYQTDPVFESINFNEERAYDTFNDSILENIIDNLKYDEENEEYYEKRPKVQSLLIIDDMAFSDELFKKNSEFNKFFLKARHLNCSIILLTQILTGLSKSIRVNATHLITFKIQNQSERNLVYQQMNVNKEKFDEALGYATSKPFDFLYVILKSNPEFYKNFEEKIEFE